MKHNVLYKLITIVLIMSTLMVASVMLVACKKNEQDEGSEDSGKQTTPVRDVEPLNIGIISDLQVTDEKIMTIGFPDDNDYLERKGTKKIFELALPLLKCAVDKFIAEKPDVVLMLGDASELGLASDLTDVAEELQRLEDAGIPVFVTNGICDINNIDSVRWYGGKYVNQYITDQEKFMNIFKDFGYSEALSCSFNMDDDSPTISYSADIPGTNYRVINLDTASLYNEDDAVDLTEAKPVTASISILNWLENALSDAQKYNKDVIVMSNLPLNSNPNPNYITTFYNGKYCYVKNGGHIEKMLAQYNVTYVFTGHMHIESTLEVTLANSVLVEEYTSSLVAYPGTIKTFKIANNNNYSVVKESVDKIPAEYIPSYLSQEDALAATTDMQSLYKSKLKEHLVRNMHYNMYEKKKEHGVTKDMIIFMLDKMELYEWGAGEHDAEIEAIRDDILNWMIEVDDTPLYGENSVASFAAGYNRLTMPVVAEYAGYNVRDFILEITCMMYDGTFVQDAGSDITKIFSCVFYKGLKMFADIDFLNRLHDINNLIRGCDVAGLIENFCQTGIANVNYEEFLLDVITMLYPYLQNEMPWLYAGLNFQSTQQLLDGIGMILPFLKVAIPDLHYFLTDENVETMKTSYADLNTGEIYGDALIIDILFPVIGRSVVNM